MRKPRLCALSQSKLLLTLAFSLALSACGSDSTAPDSLVLVGQWGSTDAELVAIHAGAEVRLACALVVVERAIPISEANTFRAQGRFYGSRAVEGTPTATVTGTLSGSQLHVTVSQSYMPEPLSYVLEAGVPWIPNEEPVCPQPGTQP
jgi:hypothetical protein